MFDWRRIAAVLAVLLVGCCRAQLKGKFIQINDLHFDPTYLSGDGISCNEDIPVKDRPLYGDYDCDSSVNLTASAFFKVDAESSETDFIIWGGDIVSRVQNDTMLDSDRVLGIINTTAHMLNDRVRSGVPIFPMLGNHDYFPKDQLPDHGTNREDSFYSRIGEVFCPLFGMESACDTFKQAGYYSMVVEERLRVIILNTNLYLISNKAATGYDPAGQFDWLRNELLASQSGNQKVHIFAHVPPGMVETSEVMFMFEPQYNILFNKIIRDFSNCILGVFTGHTHTDSFRVIYSETEPRVPLVPVFLSPSVTPRRKIIAGSKKTLARNPAIRSISYDTMESDIVLRDYTQFYLALDGANSGIDQTIEWATEYIFTKKYIVGDLSAESLHKVVTDFREMGSNYFHQYFDLNSVLIHENSDKPFDSYVCDCKCKNRHICTIQNVDYEDYDACIRDEVTCAACNIRTLVFIPFVALLSSLYNYLSS